MNDPDCDADPFVQLAEDFAGSYRRGERPSLTEYSRRYPEHAERILALFPALVKMERLGSAGQATGSFAGMLLGEGPAPVQLGEYRILREVGRGGMGIVYEAVQESLGRHVALKVFPTSRLISPTYLERFRRESRAAARLHHTNIVPVFGVGEHEGVHYFAMQFIRGQGLDHVLHELANLRRRRPSPPEGEPLLGPSIAGGLLSGRFPDSHVETRSAHPTDGASAPGHEVANPAEIRAGASSPVVLGDHSELGNQSTIAYARSVARVGVQVAEALAYAHQQGILHRDIKPANLLLDIHGTVWVSDFGLVKEHGEGDLTTHGDLVGTLRYMAPERFEGRSDPRSDIYGLGLTLYEMLTLRPAFGASDRAHLVERVQRDEPIAPRKLDSHIPRDLETIVLKAMAKDPERRYVTATAMAEDLHRFLADRPVEARRVAALERVWRWCRRNPALAASMTTAAILLLVITVGSFASASQLSAELQRTTKAEQAERDAKEDALEKLWRSHLARAQAGRFSGRPGRRVEGLAALREAGRIVRTLKAPEAGLDALRNEAIACLALPDLCPGTTSVAIPIATYTIVFDADYRRYARIESGDSKGAISVYQIGDDRPVASLAGLGRGLANIVLSPDGRFVAGYSNDAFQVWAVDGGRAVFPEPLPCRPNVFAAAGLFSADSSRVVSVRPDGSISVCELRTGREIRRLQTGIAPMTLAIHPDGRRLAVGYGEHAAVVEVWDSEAETKVAELPADDAGSVCALAWHPDGLRLALGFRTPSSRVRLWDVAASRPLATLEGHVEDVVGMAFHPGGNLLVTASVDGTSRLWDIGTSRLLATLTAAVSNLHFSRDGTVCGFMVSGGRARLLEVADGREYRTLAASPGASRDMYFEGDIGADGLLAVGMVDGVCLWDLNDGRQIGLLPIGRTDSVSFISGSEGRELLTCGLGGLRRWPIREAPGPLGLLHLGPPRPVKLSVVPRHAHVSPDGRTVAVASDHSGTARVMDLATEAVRCTLSPHPGINCAALSPDSRWVVTSGWHAASVKVWDARTGALVKELHLGKMTTAVFSPDGRMLVTSRGDAYTFWDVASWQPIRRLSWELPSYPGWVAFSPDRKLLALELSPAVIHLIDAATGRTLAKLEDPRSDRAQWIDFTPDGARLVATSRYSRAIHVWDLNTIRRQLAAMDLDWGAPLYPPAPAKEGLRPLVVESRLGESLSTEQQAVVKARSDIEKYGRDVELHPNDAAACNRLAWAFATAPAPLRDPSRALDLARKATALAPNDLVIRNTLGVAYYRDGRYREAADTLSTNLRGQKEKFVVSDLYFLAMCHHQLGEVALARAYYTWADRSTRLQTGLTVDELRGLSAFRAEADLLMGK